MKIIKMKIKIQIHRWSHHWILHLMMEHYLKFFVFCWVVVADEVDVEDDKVFYEPFTYEVRWLY